MLCYSEVRVPLRVKSIYCSSSVCLVAKTMHLFVLTGTCLGVSLGQLGFFEGIIWSFTTNFSGSIARQHCVNVVVFVVLASCMFLCFSFLGYVFVYFAPRNTCTLVLFTLVCNLTDTLCTVSLETRTAVLSSVIKVDSVD